jgi:hypothetical protein
MSLLEILSELRCPIHDLIFKSNSLITSHENLHSIRLYHLLVEDKYLKYSGTSMI